MVGRAMGATEWLLLTALSILWGGSFFFVEVLLDTADPMSVVLMRVAPAAVALTVFTYAAGYRLPRDFVTWRAFLVMGALNNAVPFTLIAWGQVHIDSGLAAIMNAATPLFTVVLAHLVTADERLTANRGIGVLVGLLGVVVLVGPEALSGLGLEVLAQLAVLGAALSYAMAGIYGRRLAVLPAPTAAAGMLIASTAIAIPVAFVLGAPLSVDPTAPALGAMLGLSLLSTACAYLIYFRVLATAGATNLLLVTFLIPPSAVVLGVVVLGEQPTLSAIAGMILVLLGLVVIDGRLIRRSAAANPTPAAR
ncbi:MAG: DMT family transporter [Alphaproteobacteria bacterium]